MPQTFWQSPLPELERWLDANASGLTATEAASRLQRFGRNALQRQRSFSVSRRLLGRLHNPLVLVLLAAASVSAITGDLNSFVIILAIVAIVTVLP